MGQDDAPSAPHPHSSTLPGLLCEEDHRAFVVIVGELWTQSLHKVMVSAAEYNDVGQVEAGALYGTLQYVSKRKKHT